MRLAPVLALALASLAPAALRAETAVFQMRLAGITLGTLTWQVTGDAPSWTTDLDSTPLGVADGVFTASAAPARLDSGEPARLYRGVTETTRKDRVIEVLHAARRIVAVSVSPPDEATPLSVASAVPDGTVDPVEAFERLLTAQGCPTAFSVYDGRRVVTIAPASSVEEAGTLTCDMTYDVVLGPGHLSPLGITHMDVSLSYDRPSGGAQALREMDVSAGLLGLRVLR